MAWIRLDEPVGRTDANFLARRGDCLAGAGWHITVQYRIRVTGRRIGPGWFVAHGHPRADDIAVVGVITKKPGRATGRPGSRKRSDYLLRPLRLIVAVALLQLVGLLISQIL